MKKVVFLALLLLTSACVSTEGLSKESSKYPDGNAKSSLLVEEFSDLQCPACKGAHTTLVKPLVEKYASAIRFEFRNFPLRQIHAFAQEAAEAAECAADQGKFWEFVDDTFEHQNELTRNDLISRAEKIGVADISLFKRCVKSRIKKDAVQKDFDEGQARGVRATPTFFVAGKPVERNTLEEMSKMIDEKLAGQRL